MVRVRKATVLCYRFFDIAEGIDLERVRATLQKSTARLSLQREGRQYLQLPNPPLGVELGLRDLGGQQVNVAARLFEQGAISVVARVPVPEGCTLDALVPIADALFDSEAMDALGRAVAEELRTAAAPAMKDDHLWSQSENYTVILVRELEGDPAAATLLDEEALPRLIIGETRERLSQSERDVVLQHVYRYGEKDLAVIDWNAAFIYEPGTGTDLADLLEVANAQLLELRYYDDVLDRELQRVYDAIEAHRAAGFFFSPYRKLLRELMLNVIELSELIERVENALKIVGDVYLARVYEGALVQLRIPQWQATVTRKHRLLTQTYDLLRGEVDTRRALTLETTVVALILIEILMAVLRFTPH